MNSTSVYDLLFENYDSQYVKLKVSTAKVLSYIASGDFKMSHKIRHRYIGCSNDLLYFAMDFRNSFKTIRNDYIIYSASSEWILTNYEETDAYFELNSKITNDIRSILDRLNISIKSFFYFIRPYHDCIYCLLLEICNMKSNIGSSMSTILTTKNNPIRNDLVENSPNYTTWFSWFRDTRNKIKSGARITFSGETLNPGISLGELMETGGMHFNSANGIMLDHLSQSLEMTTLITEYFLLKTRNDCPTGKMEN